MQTAFHIRTATHSDSAAVCELLRSSILKSCIQDHKNDPGILASWLGNKNADTVGAWLMSPSNHALVAELNREIVGIALLTNKGKIALLYVAPAMQGMGIGTGLLSSLEQQAAMWRLPVLQIASTCTAQAFFLQKDYQPKGVAASCFGIQTALLEKRVPLALNGAVNGRPVKCKCTAEN